MSPARKAALTVVVVAAVVAVAAAIVIFSGVINVSAMPRHYALTYWVLETVTEHSVERRASKIVPPPGIRYTADTLEDFHKMCELCHGAPGKKPSAIGQGLRPQPPDLAKMADKMRESEIFWIINNGIRMTGMPSFGKTHRDEELWAMVGFVKSLPRLTPDQYRRLLPQQ